MFHSRCTHVLCLKLLGAVGLPIVRVVDVGGRLLIAATGGTSPTLFFPHFVSILVAVFYVTVWEKKESQLKVFGCLYKKVV